MNLGKKDCNMELILYKKDGGEILNLKKKIKGMTDEEKRQFVKRTVSVGMVSVIVGLIYNLKIWGIVICFLFTMSVVPFYYRINLKKIHYKKKFESVILYIEQMLYSFKKRPKIREALIDATKTCDSIVKEIIEEIIVNIDSKMADRIYEESLKIIEEEYPCKRLSSMHNFMKKIESQGGECGFYIDVLMQDVKAWNDRTNLFMGEVDRIKRNVLISIGATLITCAVMTHIVPADYTYSDNVVYQISTIVMLMIMEVIYLVVASKLNYDWINEENSMTPERIDRYYSIVLEEKHDAMDYGIPSHLNWVKRSNYKTAKKKIEKEVRKQFPEWLRDVAINLQTETVQSAIENSFNEAPYVMKEPIRRMMLDFEDYPIGIEPYDRFLMYFDVPEMKSSMKMLYSISELGKEEADVQIGSVIDRNILLENQAEAIKNKDKIGAFSFLSAVPMIVGVNKIMIDMVLMIIVFTSAIGNVLSQ
ncbi:MAG: hypothetical protein K6G88_07810 [Lachnospiraceae bacterium]|nr:hypothetical protein [Lachnospiraceae bacterium]